MPTDAEITAFLCERALGWEPWADGRWYCKDHGKGHRAVKRTPDFLAWAGFGLLWEHLNKTQHEVHVCRYEDGDCDGMVLNEQGLYASHDPDPKRALMLAAARAYGMEGV